MVTKWTTLSFLILLCHVTGNVIQRATDPMAQLSQQVQQLSSKMATLEAQLNSTNHQLAGKDAVIADLTSRISTLESPVAFTVRFNHDDVGNLTIPLGTRKRLLFDRTISNTGHGYNASTGIFTAPSDGTYAFFLTVRRNDRTTDTCADAAIVTLDEHFFVWAQACPGGFTSSSNAGVWHMRQGQTAEVRSVHPETILGYVHTSFAGVKITPK